MSYKIVVLASGNGSTFQAILRHCEHVEIVGLVTDQPECFALERAKQAGLTWRVVIEQKDEQRASYDQRLGNVVEEFQPDLVVLAGFMRILTPPFVKRFSITNIHPSLLPKYKGLHTYGRALCADVPETEHGTTIHWVDETLDGGPIIAQFKVPILPTDTAGSLQARTQAVERIFYPEIIELIAQGKYKNPHE